MGENYLIVNKSDLSSELFYVNRTTDTVKVLGSDVEIQSNKQDSLAVDGTGTKYPTVDAVNAGLSSLTNTKTIQFI
jgi:hypothetical protein